MIRWESRYIVPKIHGDHPLLSWEITLCAVVTIRIPIIRNKIISASTRLGNWLKEPLNKYQKWLYSVYTNRLQTETRPLSPFFIAHGAMFAPFGVL